MSAFLIPLIGAMAGAAIGAATSKKDRGKGALMGSLIGLAGGAGGAAAAPAGGMTAAAIPAVAAGGLGGLGTGQQVGSMFGLDPAKGIKAGPEGLDFSALNKKPGFTPTLGGAGGSGSGGAGAFGDLIGQVGQRDRKLTGGGSLGLRRKRV